MRRRDLLLGLGGTATLWPRGAAAQDKRRPRLAIFAPQLPETELFFESRGDPNFQIMYRELRQRGYEEGRTLEVGRWSARGDPARYPDLAREIVRSQPDVIYTVTKAQVEALLAHTTTIPIFVTAVQLVDAGFADSHSRPGRNITGFSATNNPRDVAQKTFQLLREAIPTASRIAVPLARPGWDRPGGARQFREDGESVGLTMVAALMDQPIQPAEYRRAFAAMPEQRIDAVFVPFLPEHYANRQLIIDLAMESRLPAISFWTDVTEQGGLMSYGMDMPALWRTAADMIARLLRGEKPADMPLRSADKYELVINLKTSRALGLAIPPAFLLRADKLIE